MTNLFNSMNLKGMNVKNRVMLSPMCQYQVNTNDGTPNNWHFVHLVSRAVGGVGLICFEMTNVESRGRITEQCLGLWSEEHVAPYQKIVQECQHYGAKVAIQIAHAGRKTKIDEDMVAPSAIPFSNERPVPRALTKTDIQQIIKQFGYSAKLSVDIGVDAIELHAAHGYLLHQFLSPSSNKRDDEYGEFERFPLEVIREVKAHMPERMPLILRISAVEYNEDGYDFAFIKKRLPALIDAGVDMFDVSSGGNSPTRPEIFPGYQVKYAKVIRRAFHTPVISVGALDNPQVANAVLENGEADMIAIGKGLLRQPYWLKEAARIFNEPFDLPGVYNLGYPAIEKP